VRRRTSFDAILNFVTTCLYCKALKRQEKIVQHSLRFLIAAVGLALGSAGHAQSAPADEPATFESVSAAPSPDVDFAKGSVSALGVSTDLVAPAIPEPETYALMLAGIAMLGLVSRRRSPR
jgi:hypothetical protein